MIGKPSAPSASSAFRRMTPVVVSSVPAMMSPSCSRRARVEDADHVGAVVHRQLRLVVDRGLDVRVVGVVVLALDREDGDVVLVDERRGDVVLRRERVRGAEHDVGAARLERAHQVRGLGRHVQARGDAVAGERLLALEPLADRGQHRHLPVGPHDPPHALGRERQVLHVVSSSSSPCSLSSRVGVIRRREAARACAAPTRPRPASSAPASQPSTAARSSGSRRSRAANARSASSTPKRSRSSRSERSWFSSREPVEPVARTRVRAARRARAARGSGASAADQPVSRRGRSDGQRASTRATLTQVCQGSRRRRAVAAVARPRAGRRRRGAASRPRGSSCPRAP